MMNTRKQTVLSLKQTNRSSDSIPTVTVLFVCIFPVFFFSRYGSSPLAASDSFHPLEFSSLPSWDTDFFFAVFYTDRLERKPSPPDYILAFSYPLHSVCTSFSCVYSGRKQDFSRHCTACSGGKLRTESWLLFPL